MLLIKQLLNSIIKLIKGIYMARPREIVLEHGTVSLKGFSKEEADKIVALLKPPKLATIESPVESTEKAVELVKSAAKPATSELKEKALSLCVDKINLVAELVTISYNRTTQECKIESIVKAQNVNDAITKYKIASANLNFV